MRRTRNCNGVHRHKAFQTLMKKIILFGLLLLPACRVVNDETAHVADVPVASAPSPYSRIDSLLQTGHQDSAVRLLRNIHMTADNRNDLLWRFTGAYNGRGMPGRCIEMLDSLESAGWGDLTGWKISVLDLNRMTETALELAEPEDVLLKAWLLRDSLNTLSITGSIPIPTHLGERAARLLLAPEGITREQLMLASEDVHLLPVTVGPRIRDELLLSCGSTGSWWEDVLKNFDPELNSQSAISLQAQRKKRLSMGDRSYWTSLLNTEAGALAASVTASRWPEYVDWQVCDLLIENGGSSQAMTIAENRGDPDFTAGVRMAVLRSSADYSDLAALCDSIPDSAAEELRARASLFKARALRGQRRNAEAYRAYYHFAESFPWHSTAREAAYLAGKYFDSEQNWREAADAYLASLRSSGAWDGDARGHWRGGFCLYMNGRGSVGDSLWEAGCARYPFSHWRDEMLFWRARYAERTGESERQEALLSQVAADHPWEFYGMLAAERLGIPYRIDMTVLSPVIHGNLVLETAAELFQEGYGTAAVEMLSYGRIAGRGSAAAAMGIIGEHGRAISLMRRLDTEYRENGTGILPDSLIGWYFPCPYRELVTAVTDTMTLDASYVEGIMREESYFNRFVISSAGAAGLIQLMPGTASDVARWNGLPRLSPEEFFTPEHSVLYGSLYINSQARRYSHPAVFLAAYNAGPGNASRWIDMHGFDSADQELYIEQITYRETRMYSKKVQRSAWIYGRIRR